MEGTWDNDGDTDGNCVSEGSCDKEGIADGKTVTEGTSELEGALENVGDIVGAIIGEVGNPVLVGLLDGEGVGAGDAVG